MGLNKINWNSNLNTERNVEEKWYIFKNKILSLINNFLPKELMYENSIFKWSCLLNGKELEKIKERDKAWRKYLRIKYKKNYKIYTKLRNRARKITRLKT